MRRGINIRRLFAIATAVSSLLIIASVFLWVRSYWSPDAVRWCAWEYNGSEANRQLEERTLYLGRGIICFGHGFTRGNTTYVDGLREKHGDRDHWIEWPTNSATTRVGGSGFWNERGFGYVYNRSNSSSSSYISWRREMMLPIWTLCLLFALLHAGALFVKMNRRRRRLGRQLGRCESCGYDLRATPERCPECGAGPAVDRPYVMPSSAEPNFDSLGLAKQIIDLNAKVDREVQAGQYERAAEFRDQREVLQQQLSQFGDPTVVQRVQRKLHPPTRSLVLSLLEHEESAVDAGLLRLMRSAPLPPRWVLNGYVGSCRATVAQLLNVDALDSVYFQAQLPVLNATTLSKSTKPMELLAEAIREAARETSPVVWIVNKPAYLAERGILDVLLQVLRVPSTQFVVCLQDGDTSFAEIPGVTTMRT